MPRPSPLTPAIPAPVRMPVRMPAHMPAATPEVSSTTAPAACLTALARQPLVHVLTEFREGRIRATLLASILWCAGCTAADELLALCAFASREGQAHCDDTARLRNTVISLLTTPVTGRTFDQLRDTGMFGAAPLHDGASRDDLDLLSSDEGLLLWLRYGATPDGYHRLFVDHVSQRLHSQITPEPHSPDLGPALRVLVAAGRDRVIDVPDPYNVGRCLPPLSHLCATHAPDWLAFLLDITPCANQRDVHGYPLVYTALTSVTLASRRANLSPHALNHAIQDRVALLVNHGAQLSVSDLAGMPLTARLVLDGYIDAARVVLQFGACPAATDREMNSVLHHLARTLQSASSQYSAAIVAIVSALAAGGDANAPNASGETAIDLLPPFQRKHFIFLASHYARWMHASGHPGLNTP
ncbi:ankyrin [Pandoraea iniqua]|uniref:Ankyrin n=2 Tax=Pandoraea iniqua TaxID=2508288 RepID=A0A5E4WF45_9BURK|nr:ankyrin [Pandoraea iniqua]